ncbi:MAG TPA: hypothetical protein VFW90_04470 [Candidatus Saccharimonadales bacterium]|nr:hypothetical protein [Candidatus Saccharimonadales bacterium]
MKIIAIGNLGAGNRGSIGPSKREAGYSMRLADPEYRSQIADESHCMDDRLNRPGILLAGNRAITETGGNYLDPQLDSLPLSKALPKKVTDLVRMGRKPNFHDGCAALASLCSGDAIGYIADENNQELLTRLANDRLRLAGVKNLAREDYRRAFGAATEAAGHKKELFDITSEQAMKIALKAGGGHDPMEGNHQAVAVNWIVSENTFDNGRFRSQPEHKSDGGEPLGALSVTLGAYKKQLEEDGYSPKIVDQMMLRATLIQLAVLKPILKQDALDIIVG